MGRLLRSSRPHHSSDYNVVPPTSHNAITGSLPIEGLRDPHYVYPSAASGLTLNSSTDHNGPSIQGTIAGLPV